DVDHFKSFNDTWGHDVGDEVLKMVARQVDSVKGGGTAYRYGGEEFCIVFGRKTIAECKPFLETVRAQVESYKMVLRDKKNRSRTQESAKQRRGRRRKNRNVKTVSVTVSIGVAAADEIHNRPETVIKAADAALYKAKKQGRNRLVVSD
ncbi:MAG TPA: GGDEF domain-containing protein, partial [Gammaproteobacteria bacterium]|nr:GGDEF domain-containing protein [Gammaproteobacteria bacterium]